MNRCNYCKEEKVISRSLPFCRECIINHFDEIEEKIREIHNKTREEFGLPVYKREAEGIECYFCGNRCKIEEGEKGFCGTKENRGGKIFHLYGTPEKGKLSWYFDKLPTNCVADWVCPGSKEGRGRKNLAVFYSSCNFNCLFCQNWHFRIEKEANYLTSEELADVVDEKTFCVCFFGGDPTTQVLHALKTSEEILKKNPHIRICWETNGGVNRKYLEEMAEISFNSGGCIKFDLKFFNENLNIAVCGVSNKTTLENFSFLALKYLRRKRDYPFLIASSLLVPGYIDENEISKIAEFISKLNPDIPYRLLAFHPSFYFSDLPTTSCELATKSFEIAKEKGLKNISIGNIHLLS